MPKCLSSTPGMTRVLGRNQRAVRQHRRAPAGSSRPNCRSASRRRRAALRASIVTIIRAYIRRIQERKGMAAISRRPWLPLCAALALSLILAACSLLKPAQAPEDKQARALRLGRGQACGGGAGVRGTRGPAAGRPRQLRTAERRTMAGRRQCRGRETGVRGGLAGRAHPAADCARAGRRGNRLRRERRRPRHSANWIRSRCRRRPTRRRTTGGFAAAARSSPGTRSRARAPWSSASAG